MCLAVPGKIIEVDGSNPDLRMAKVEFAGVVKEICIEWLPEAKDGDWVLAHVGMALNLISEEDAEETIRLLREMGDLPEDKGE